MSKSELKAEKKKRKREEDGAEEVAKRSKKSKKSRDPAADEAAVVAEKKEKKDKKSKKPKSADETLPAIPPVEAAAPEVEISKAATADTTSEQDFIRFDDELMPDSFSSNTNGTLSRTASRKEKKDRKSKKTKEALEVASGEVNGASETMDVGSAEEDEAAKPKKDKKSKKDKKAKKSKDEVRPEHEQRNRSTTLEETPALETAANEADDKTSKSKNDKKKSKKEKKASKMAESEAQGEPVAEPNGTAEEENAEQGAEPQYEDPSGKITRFIVFVGNLPYSATKEQIETHFAKLKPFEVRMRTYKNTGEFMGTCFIEFERFDHMQTALTKYHHSVFQDGKKKDGRKINVELSAGGGGNKPDRMQKIKAKNERLHNERQRIREKRDEVESKQKERKEKKEARQGKDGEEDTGTAAEAETATTSDEHGGMHPARLAMMQQGPPRWQKNHKQRY